MKIVHVMDWYIPNMGYQENYLPFHQQKLGHEVYIITSNLIPSKFKKKSYEKFELGSFQKNGVKIHRLKSIYLNKETGGFYLHKLGNILKRINPDVIHGHGFLNILTLQAIIYCKKNNVKLFVDCHVDNDNFHLDKFYKKVGFLLFKNFFLPRIIKETNVFLPVNPYAEDFLKNLGIPTPKIKLLPLGVDTSLFYSANKKRSNTREHLGVNKNEILLISSGNLDSSKDLDVLLNSFSCIVKRYEDSKLLLLGKWEQKYRRKINDLIKKLNIEEHIIFHDFVPHYELNNFYNAADISVFPGKLGIAMIEAIGPGLPIVVCDSPATEFIIQNGNGLSFERGNVKELTRKIEEYLDNPELRKKHEENALKLVQNKLSWEKIAEKSLSIYKKELGEK